MTVSISGTGGVTFNDSSVQDTAATGFGFKNRIINGAMVIDQRNAGASVTLNDTTLYTLDRWYATEDTDGGMTAQQVSTAPAGFTNSIKITTTTADASLAAGQFCRLVQAIEGYNMADLGWGTAAAQTVTLSFWVRSSLTGTFGGAFRNSAGNRSYPFTYSISVADTWEQKSVTVAGDTSGTWLTTNGAGVHVQFGLGVGSTYSGTAGAWASSYLLSATGAVSVIGTLNATFYITGVQLEKGSTATSFDYRPYGTELALCQRYYQRYAANASYLYITNWGSGASATSMRTTISPKVSFRVAPTSLDYANIALDDHVSVFTATSVTTYGSGSVDTIGIVINVASGLTQFRPYVGTSTTSNGYIGLSAEL